MSHSPDSAAPRNSRSAWIAFGVIALVLAAIAFDTKVIHVGSEQDLRQQAFSPATWGQQEFPRVQEYIQTKAIDALALGPAVLADKDAAAKEFGTASTTGAIMMVKFTGVAGEAKSGVYEIKVDGLPEEIRLRLQTGPAINGTDLRDAPGDIAFGSFKNQIEYQDAGSGLNNAMKAAVLAGTDTSALTGKTVEVIGAFRLINPKMWLVTPVALSVQ